MKKIINFICLILLIINIIKCDDSGRIDLSDKNPIVFCLKKVKNYNLEQVKDFILRNQDPEYAIEHYPNDEIFAYCMEQVSKENN